ncbi:MAG: hypothetical protein SFU99_18965 [Saprospiraceae bacterium]|nr:hypothetical protein [Saprospiraceae bacterium]
MKKSSYFLLWLITLLSCNLKEDLNFTEKVDLSDLNSKSEYFILQGFAKLVPSKLGIVLFVENNNKQESKTFLLQSTMPLLKEEKTLGQGKIYYRGDLLYFDGNEQLSLFLSDITLPIKLKNSYTGFGLVQFNQLVDINYLEEPGDASCKCKENSESGGDCDEGGPGHPWCTINGNPDPNCNCLVNCSSGYFACCIECINT